ncbi:adhesion G-protein coupled receptor G5-like isoform X1 [Hippocampus zosterae]|uniref:adhesion G-protein coupled receptor G5-like isoform X1 n=1 Tax=Hippocampus zosterae TaxID=109293 RepID=UPI00223DFDE0|nr:adhesion G-protein coupled receptor G5-like isoform X1 [Hippocampus zosterae]XP_051918472.1 adhesion G-protein coupled receptor G5-like isoform X1 [Hippocampus zosterae]
MEAPLAKRLAGLSVVIFLLSQVSCRHIVSCDRDLHFCGTWRHGNHPLSLNFDISPGCGQIIIAADESSLAVRGQIAAQCRRSGTHQLIRQALDSDGQSRFCLYWEPLQDQLKLQVGMRNFTLCWPSGMPDSCCTYLSYGSNAPEATYGISDGLIENDTVTRKTLTAYTFDGTAVKCATFCSQQSSGGAQVHVTDRASVEALCALSSEVELKDGFRGMNINSPRVKGIAPESTTPTIHLPPALKQAAKNNSKVVYTFFKNNSIFQEGLKEVRVLDDVVEISVGNQVIQNLTEPIRIGFHHDVIPKTHSRTCVSWDTRKDPMRVKWSVEGCKTQQRGEKHTDCLCDHLTYFTVLVQLEPRPVRHLLALTVITSLGCATSFVSGIALIVFLCRRRRAKDPSTPIHLGLAVSLTFLNVLFFFTGVLANVGGQELCVLIGAGLHYALLSAFSWMGIEVFHTFWLVYVVFRPSPKLYVWNVVGFILPAIPVVILARVDDIYGLREVASSEDEDNPFLMCWMKPNPTALLAHHLTNTTMLALLVSAGLVMLLLVYREIRTRDEWQNNRVAFLSIWGLSCLFGTTWGLAFLDFGPFSDFILFLSCILNSFQGFLLMLRFFMLDWMRKHAVRIKESPAKVCHMPTSPSTISQEPLEPLCPRS